MESARSSPRFTVPRATPSDRLRDKDCHFLDKGSTLPLMPDTALVDTPVAYTPKYKRVTPAQRAIIRDLAKLNTPQVEIARVLGVSQPTVSRWLEELTDTSEDASAYLRAKALPIAEKIFKKGRPSDFVKVLQGISVLDAGEKSGGITINVGGNAQIALLHGARAQVLSPRDSEG
jgi:DNA-binding transcriptional regulator YiaG